MEVIGCDDTGQVRKVHFYAPLQLLLQPVWLYHISHLARKGLHLVVTNAKKMTQPHQPHQKWKSNHAI